MQQHGLPDEIRGKWIWLEDVANRLDGYLFFRRDVTLFETPASAELWITARTQFHLFFNGRHIAFGPPFSPTDHAYVQSLDVGFLAETGKNTIAVLAHNTSVSRFAARRQPCGLWVQLNIDGEPSVWTDETWYCREADCFRPNQPRRSASGAFVESVDLTAFPANWCEKEYNPHGWHRPDVVERLSATDGRLEAAVGAEWGLDKLEPTAVLCRGEGQAAATTTWVSFSHLVRERGPGVYVAEGYVHSAQDQSLPVEIYADDPYRFYVNGGGVNSQGVLPLPPRADLNRSRSPCYRQADISSPEAVITLRKGWNRFVLAQQSDTESAGITFIFPQSDVGSLALQRGPEDNAPEGWNLFGPFRTPLALLTGNVELRSLPRAAYDPDAHGPVDISAALCAWSFNAEADIKLPPTRRVALQQGDYIIFDLGRTVYGCPEFTPKGTDGDILDVICGEHYVDGQLVPMLEGKRCTDSLRLAPSACTWRSCHPRGLRYIMLLARKAAGRIDIADVGVVIRECAFPTPGAFASSDEVLNDIWDTGRRTLQSTVQIHFLDSPAKDQTQYITDSMIQAWAAYHTFGAYDLGAKSLREFARVQFETGEMNAVCPSDMFLHMPDYSLMWIVWLQRHFLYTGDTELLRELLPNLQRLLDYYHSLSVPGRDILSDLHELCGGYCFLDHGEIDRAGVVTGLNAIYCRSLLSGAWLLNQAGDTERASILRRRAAHVARAIRQLAWDEERGLFADGWSDGDMSEFYSWQTNVLAIYGGIARPEHYGIIFDKLFCPDEPYELFSAGDTNNSFFKYFVLESAFAIERREWALKLIRWYWGQMLDRGARTWWELFDPDAPEDEVPTYSMCHGYGASPNGYLCSELAGIRPALPGFEMAYFNPLVGLTDWVKARIPTPRGHVDVDWHVTEDGQFEAMIDANHPLEVIPVLSPGIAESAVIHVSDEVSILAEPAEEE